MQHRKMVIGLVVLTILITLVASPLFAQKNGASARGRGRGTTRMMNPNTAAYAGSIEVVLNDIEPGELTSEEKAGIMLMREEEKLARDVYLTLYEKWNIPVFSNIAESEQTHMDAMELLIERYGLEDPISDESASSRGSYTRAEFEDLYTELTEQGLASYSAALEVGALIEDLDIADLERLISESENNDVRIVYQNLLKGSRNHLRSFDRQLVRSGGSYGPQYVTELDYENIVSSRNEAGVITDPDFIF